MKDTPSRHRCPRISVVQTRVFLPNLIVSAGHAVFNNLLYDANELVLKHVFLALN